MRDVQLKTAKATLSALVDETRRGEEFAITRHGRREAVVISWENWERLKTVPSLGWLLSHPPEEIVELPERDRSPARNSGL